MATTLKILGQLTSTATTEGVIYTVPANTSTVVSTITVCNRDAANSTFRVSVSENGASTTNKDYIYYDTIIGSYDTFAATLGLTLASGDVVRAYSDSSNLSFNLFGQENS